MLTNNGKAFLFVSDYWDGSNAYTDTPILTTTWNPQYELLRTNNQTVIIERHTNKYPPEQSYNYLASSLEVVVGTGTTAANVNDYQLENEITSTNLQILSKSSKNKQDIYAPEAGVVIMQADKVYYNSSLINSITINEVGLIAKDGFGYSYLLYRDVLNTPIVILPNDSATISIIIK